MIDIILDTLIDALKLLPFLFATFLVIEYIEHKLKDKPRQKLQNSKYGPVIGALLGAFPQCGFSVAATNLYITRIISLGTLIAIFLSTSDEMLPILIANKTNPIIIIKIVSIKIIIGMICGIIIDLIYKKNKKEEIEKSPYEICEHSKCGCNNNIIKSSLKHTINILIFIIIISFILNLSLSYLGQDKIKTLFLNNNIFAPFISGLIGLIPNCGASIVLTELYLEDVITLGTSLSGLLSGSGIGLLVLIKQNKNIKQNILIILTIYLIGVISGIIINLINIM